MPISKKIIEKINSANVNDKERELMIDILEIEDEGNFRYDAAYEKTIKNYIASVENDGGMI